MENLAIKPSSNLAIYVEKFGNTPKQIQELPSDVQLCCKFADEKVLEGGEFVKNPKISDTTANGLLEFAKYLTNYLQVQTQYKHIFGQTVTEIEENKKQFILVLAENLQKDHRFMRQLEVREAVRRGCNKRYLVGDFFCLSPAEVSRWVTCYLQEKQIAIIQAMHEAEKQKDNENLRLAAPTMHSNKLQAIYNHKLLCEQYGAYKPFGFENYAAGHYFEYLQKNNFIAFTNSEKLQEIDTQLLAILSDFVSKRSVRKLTNEEKVFIRDLTNENTKDLPARHRVDKKSSVYATAVEMAKKSLFAKAIMSKTADEWRVIFNKFLSENKYQTI